MILGVVSGTHLPRFGRCLPPALLLGLQRARVDLIAHCGERVDAILFGHSHIPYRALREGVLLFNPGSPTDKRTNAAYSYGIVRIDGRRLNASHRFYPSRA